MKSLVLDWRTFTPSLKTYYGVYGDDFIRFGEYAKNIGDPLNNEEALIKICDEVDLESAPVKNLFKFENNQLFYSKVVNEELRDVEVEHPIKETQLETMIDQTWTEVLFYGLGNKHIAAPKMKRGEEAH